MPDPATDRPVSVVMPVVPENTAGVLYGLYDVLSSVGDVWSRLTGEAEPYRRFAVQIASLDGAPLNVAGGVPISPHVALQRAGPVDVVLVTDLDIPHDSDPRGRWPELAEWLAARHAAGATICSVCSGAVLLAEAGLLDGREATTHWAFARLFEAYYPSVTILPDRVMVPAQPDQRVITASGAASWEDLALFLIGRYSGAAAAIRTAKIFLLGDRSDGQLPYAAMTRPSRHEDAVIAACQVWIADNYALANPVSRLVARSGLAERTFKRRFRAATGYTPVAYVQTLRIEEAKQLLETTALPIGDVGAAVGYEDPAFFRRLFKRLVGVTPARYRQRLRTVIEVAGTAQTAAEQHGAISAT